MIIAVTGHRPQKLGGFSKSGYLQERLIDLARAALKKLQPRGVITGMALGWDQAVAEACVELDIPWVAAVPFEGQERMWPEEAQQKYHELLSKATKIVVVSEGGYSPHKFQIRNEWMVDRADRVLALWNGSDSGTGHTVHDAQHKGIRVTNLWKSWTKYMSPLPSHTDDMPPGPVSATTQGAPPPGKLQHTERLYTPEQAHTIARELVAQSAARQAQRLSELGW